MPGFNPELSKGDLKSVEVTGCIVSHPLVPFLDSPQSRYLIALVSGKISFQNIMSTWLSPSVAKAASDGLITKEISISSKVTTMWLLRWQGGPRIRIASETERDHEQPEAA